MHLAQHAQYHIAICTNNKIESTSKAQEPNHDDHYLIEQFNGIHIDLPLLWAVFQEALLVLLCCYGTSE